MTQLWKILLWLFFIRSGSRTSGYGRITYTHDHEVVSLNSITGYSFSFICSKNMYLDAWNDWKFNKKRYEHCPISKNEKTLKTSSGVSLHSDQALWLDNSSHVITYWALIGCFKSIRLTKGIHLENLRFGFKVRLIDLYLKVSLFALFVIWLFGK